MFVFQRELESESVSAQLCPTLWTEARQAPLSKDFSRQEYWSGLPFLLQGIDPGIEPGSLSLQADMLYCLYAAKSLQSGPQAPVRNSSAGFMNTNPPRIRAPALLIRCRRAKFMRSRLSARSATTAGNM